MDVTIEPWLNRHRPEDLLPQHDQGIGGIGDAPPLRVVIGLELPGLA
jgi:hypothetical protein